MTSLFSSGTPTFYADRQNKIIDYIGPHDAYYTCQEFYLWTTDVWITLPFMDEDIAVIAITPEIYEMANDWEITTRTANRLTRGSITSPKIVYSSVVELGGENPIYRCLMPHHDQNERNPGCIYKPYQNCALVLNADGIVYVGKEWDKML